MAVVHTLEEGESSWDSNFQLLEVLVMGDQGKVGHKPTKPLFDSNSDSKDSKKVIFCKKYQVDDCHMELKNNAHWGTLGGKSPLLHHCSLSSEKKEIRAPQGKNPWMSTSPQGLTGRD